MHSIGLLFPILFLVYPGVVSVPSPHRYPADVHNRDFAWDDNPIKKGKSVDLKLRTFAGTIKLSKRLGKGSFGEVYKGEFINGPLQGKQVAVRRDLQRSAMQFRPDKLIPYKYTQIEHEFHMLFMFRHEHGFPEIYAANFAGRNKYYVMELLGRSLQSVRTGDGKGVWRLPPHIAVPIAIQMVNRIRTVHEAGYVVYDLHFGNFLIKEETKTVYLIDLGMAYPYMIDGKHIPETQSPIPYRPKMHYFTSRQDERDLVSGRRDDLERLLFLIVKLMVRNLPWDNARDYSALQKIKTKKLTPSMICERVPWLKPAFDHVFRLRFDQEPDYDLIIRVLESGAP